MGSTVTDQRLKNMTKNTSIQRRVVNTRSPLGKEPCDEQLMR